MTLELISRAEARRVGKPRYFTGKPCARRGHISERSTHNAGCTACHKERVERYRAADPEAWKARQRESNARYVAAREDYHAQVYAKHRDKIQARVKRWLEARPDYKTARSRQRNYRIQLATPHWLTDEQRQAMDRIYEEAACRHGGPWHVDHIIPLQGRNVCGLHVPWNLQIISKAENLAKGAWFSDDGADVRAA